MIFKVMITVVRLGLLNGEIIVGSPLKLQMREGFRNCDTDKMGKVGNRWHLLTVEADKPILAVNNAFENAWS